MNTLYVLYGVEQTNRVNFCVTVINIKLLLIVVS